MRTTQAPSLLLTPGQARMVGEAEASVFVLESTQPLLAFSLTVVMCVCVCVRVNEGERE